MKAEKDCLTLFRQRVMEAGLLDAAELDAIAADAKAEIDADASTGPSPRRCRPTADLLTDVYVRYAS